MPPTTHQRADVPNRTDSTHPRPVVNHLRPAATTRAGGLGASIPATRGITHTRPRAHEQRDAAAPVTHVVDLAAAELLDGLILDAIDLGIDDDAEAAPTVPAPVLFVSTLRDDPLAERLRDASVEIVRFDDPVRTPAAIDLHEPGLIVLHLETTGVEALRACRIAAEASATPVVVVSATMSETQRSVAVMLGVRDVINAAEGTDAIVAQLAMLARQHCARRTGLARRLAVGDAVLDLGRRRLLAAGRPVALTRTEMELLRALALRPDIVCSRTDLIREVWGPDWVGAPKVLDTHIAHLRAKLAGCRSGATISTVRGVGYYLDGDDGTGAEQLSS